MGGGGNFTSVPSSVYVNKIVNYVVTLVFFHFNMLIMLFTKQWVLDNISFSEYSEIMKLLNSKYFMKLYEY